MGTVNKDIADKIAKADGHFSDDPRVVRIVEYDNAWGVIGYGLEYARNRGYYAPSEFVCNPRVYWEAAD